MGITGTKDMADSTAHFGPSEFDGLRRPELIRLATEKGLEVKPETSRVDLVQALRKASLAGEPPPKGKKK